MGSREGGADVGKVGRGGGGTCGFGRRQVREDGERGTGRTLRGLGCDLRLKM